MSTVWTPLLPVAMLGADRHAPPASAWPGEIGDLIAQALADSAEPARGVLRASAVLATCSVAGGRGVAWDAALPAAAAAERWPAWDGAPWRGLMDWALREGPPRLQAQLFRHMAAAQRRLPHALLPLALELGRRSLALRPGLVAVIGERGLWLAAQREDWRYAAGVSAGAEDGTRWTEGSFEQRRDFLLRERAQNAAAARARYAQALDSLPAKERAELLPVLAQGLGADDEPLLDGLRSDRSREVRDAALRLLLRLPQAAHVQRAEARMATCLSVTRVLLMKRWQVDAPTTADPAWKADNVDPARPKNEALGERAWWLYQLVRQVPLRWWTDHTGMTPAELLAWADVGDWAEALLRGWREVMLAAPEPAWGLALLARWPAVSLSDGPARVLAMLPAALRERHVIELLKGERMTLAALLHQLLAACPVDELLSPELSSALVERLTAQALAGALNTDFSLRALLPELGCVLHAELLSRLAELPRHADESPSLAQVMHTTTQVVALRLAFRSLPNPT